MEDAVPGGVEHAVIESFKFCQDRKGMHFQCVYYDLTDRTAEMFPRRILYKRLNTEERDKTYDLMRTWIMEDIERNREDARNQMRRIWILMKNGERITINASGVSCEKDENGGLKKIHIQGRPNVDIPYIDVKEVAAVYARDIDEYNQVC